MKYLGGKCHLAKEIGEYLNYLRKSGQLYIEPFVGAGWVLAQVDGGPNMACDVHPQLIAMWKALQEGWQPPTIVNYEDWCEARDGKLDAATTAFIGFACSFGGKWFGGFARNATATDYALQGAISLIKKFCNIAKDTEFFCCSYLRLNPPSGSLIYCDPPYAGTTKYKDTKAFDSELFWWTMDKWAKYSTVIVSEYNAPRGWKCIRVKRVKTVIKHPRIAGEKELNRTEKLFVRFP